MILEKEITELAYASKEIEMMLLVINTVVGVWKESNIILQKS